jgi:hypothetical protein
MKLKTVSFYITIIAIFFSSIVSAQDQQHDSSFTTIAVNNAIEVYHHTLDKASGIYNGAEYDGYSFRFEEGIPWFGAKDSVAGSVAYDGVLYRDIFMKYDEIKDMLVIWYNNDAIRLLNEKISHFNMQGHSFIRLIKDNQSRELVNTGFYEQLYTGKTTALKKTIKTIQEKSDISDGLLKTIDQKTYFYLRTTHGYISVSDKGDVTEALKDHKKEIKDFIGSNNLNFKKDPAGFLAKVAAYYDTL